MKGLDNIQPYRLEMGVKLETDKGSNLYKFWGDSITDAITNDANSNAKDDNGKGKFVVNVASQEYFKSVNTKKLATENGIPIYTMKFVTKATVYAKQARGEMARFCIVNQVNDIEKLKDFIGK